MNSIWFIVLSFIALVVLLINNGFREGITYSSNEYLLVVIIVLLSGIYFEIRDKK